MTPVALWRLSDGFEEKERRINTATWGGLGRLAGEVETERRTVSKGGFIGWIGRVGDGDGP